ncbi:hypothetical protein [Bosea sp. CS1GBMeth4]|uniref:hypothetical protein n=1 Tax=Bosea sp. CS1GBMeth4 TaxID=1892849 RepID=UPI001646538A|nr:hypothetical protein [Bosea sp. CS1GBMeth4]
MTMPDDHGRHPESHALLDRCLQADVGWIELIKEIRSRCEMSLPEAQELALSHEGWRRWVARRLNIDPRCRKQASRHIRDHGAASFFVQRGDRIELR